VDFNEPQRPGGASDFIQDYLHSLSVDFAGMFRARKYFLLSNQSADMLAELAASGPIELPSLADLSRTTKIQSISASGSPDPFTGKFPVPQDPLRATISHFGSPIDEFVNQGLLSALTAHEIAPRNPIEAAAQAKRFEQKQEILDFLGNHPWLLDTALMVAAAYAGTHPLPININQELTKSLQVAPNFEASVSIKLNISGTTTSVPRVAVETLLIGLQFSF